MKLKLPPLISILSIFFLFGLLGSPLLGVEFCHYNSKKDKYVLKDLSQSKHDKHISRHDHDLSSGSYHPDVDGDGFGDGTVEAIKCPGMVNGAASDSWADNGSDLDDTDPEIGDTLPPPPPPSYEITSFYCHY